jgi:6-pyruvoyltetrahydropterin/6-carboxytetrahydropterin synthase
LSHEVKSGPVYKQGHGTKGKTYLGIYGTSMPKVGYQHGEKNIAKDPEIAKKISTALKNGAHWIFHSPEVGRRKTSKVEDLVAKYLQGWKRQYHIGRYQVDFASLNEKKILEVNGCFWHNCSICGFDKIVDKQVLEKSISYEKQRLSFIKAKGWEVEILWEHDIPLWIAKKIHNSLITATRYHDFSSGHRVYGHEGACSHAHGHNYRIHFTCVASSLDSIGRVIDFGVINTLLCQWLETNWDHRFLIWKKDPWSKTFKALDKTVVITPFNPTAENIAKFLVEHVGPKQLTGTGVHLVKCCVEETRKCSATFELTSTTMYSLVYTNSGLLVLPKELE